MFKEADFINENKEKAFLEILRDYLQSSIIINNNHFEPNTNIVYESTFYIPSDDIAVQCAFFDNTIGYLTGFLIENESFTYDIIGGLSDWNRTNIIALNLNSIRKKVLDKYSIHVSNKNKKNTIPPSNDHIESPGLLMYGEELGVSYYSPTFKKLLKKACDEVFTFTSQKKE